MRASALMRAKYDRPDYLPRTIGKACASTRNVYSDRRREAIAPAAPSAIAVQPGGPDRSLTFLASAQGAIPATIENVTGAIQSPESGVHIGFDAFLGQIMIGSADRAMRPFTDADYGRLRLEFGRRGFRPVTAEIMKTAVLIAAEDRPFDSAIDWAESLQWDGRPRIDTAMTTYYRTADTPYTRAVAAYLFTALAARALRPGCQADMAVVLVGMQGARKTSAVLALCPDPAFFAEINLKKIDEDDQCRMIRGKLIGEIAELRGLAGRDQESVKAWVSRRVERWRPVYREFETTYPRRLVLIGTTNEREFLDDPTGERRWLPLLAGAVDVEAIERDRDQLWAEGVARFKSGGVAWRDAERLARDEHAGFKIVDPWHEAVDAWLSAVDPATGRARGAAPLRLADLWSGALNRTFATIERKDETRVGRVLRALGYEKSNSRVDGRVVKVWTRAALPLSPSA